MHQKGQSTQLALQISTSYVLWQHQMSAPKWATSARRCGGSNAWEDESRVPSGPAQPGLEACPANATMGLSNKVLSPGTCCSGEAELRTRPAGKIPQSAKTAELGWPEHSNSLPWLRAPQVCSSSIIQAPHSKMCLWISTFTVNCQEMGSSRVQWAF